MAIGIETRASIPLNKLQKLEDDLVSSFNFSGSLVSSGVGILPNGIIIRAQESENAPKRIALEFAYPPFKSYESGKSDDIIDQTCKQYAALFHLIKRHGGNPYPWYINFLTEKHSLEGYTEDTIIVRSLVVNSVNPIHINNDNSRLNNMFRDGLEYLTLFSSVGGIEENEIQGPLLKIKSGGKEIDLREISKNFIFPTPNFCIRSVVEERDGSRYHLSTTTIPQIIFPLITKSECSYAEKISQQIKSVYFDEIPKRSRHSYYGSGECIFTWPVESSRPDPENHVLSKMLKGLETEAKAPLQEIIFSNKFYKIAQGYIKEKWGIEGENPMANIYAWFLEAINYVDNLVPEPKDNIYNVTDFHTVSFDSGWLHKFIGEKKVDVFHEVDYSIDLVSLKFRKKR